ncbi:MAG: EamA family transporter [Chloroflexi bacterium]|nr:EamA family transporter [Chloroflexota bacterium]
MPALAILLVLAAAVLHAFWNFLAKDARDSSAFMWWGVAVGAVWNALFVVTQTSLALPLETWLYLLPSLVAEIAYVALISRGYDNGDLSQVYPIARGTPPLFIALWSAIFLGERLPILGYAGIALLMIGIYLASLRSFDDVWKPLRSVKHRPTQFALLAALCVSVYSTLDKMGVGHTTPLVYNVWVYAGIAIGYAPFVWARGNRASTAREWRANWRRIVMGSVATVGSYLLALTGMTLTAASYVGAVRATSVVMGALLGWLWLKEQFGAVRVFASALMVAGLAMVALA